MSNLKINKMENYFGYVLNKVFSYSNNEGTFEVNIPLPGVSKEDLEVKVVKDILSVKIKKGGLFVSGERRIALPEDISIKNIDAKLVSGLLTIVFNKKEESLPFEIVVK